MFCAVNSCPKIYRLNARQIRFTANTTPKIVNHFEDFFSGRLNIKRYTTLAGKTQTYAGEEGYFLVKIFFAISPAIAAITPQVPPIIPIMANGGILVITG